MSAIMDKVVNRTNHWPTQTQVREHAGRAFIAIGIILAVGVIIAGATAAGGVTLPAALLITAFAGVGGSVASVGAGVLILPNNEGERKRQEALQAHNKRVV